MKLQQFFLQILEMQLWVVELSLKMLFCKNQKRKENKISHGMMTNEIVKIFTPFLWSNSTTGIFITFIF
jgi:hypothetical protein